MKTNTGSYKKQLEARRFKYDQDRDALSRALKEMVDILRWQFWIMLVLVLLVGGIFLWCCAYILSRGLW